MTLVRRGNRAARAKCIDLDHSLVINCHYFLLWGGGVMEHEFYRGLAQRVRDIAERADPFIKRRLLKLAERYAVKGIRREPAPGTERPLPIPRPRLLVVRGPEEG